MVLVSGEQKYLTSSPFINLWLNRGPFPQDVYSIYKPRLKKKKQTPPNLKGPKKYKTNKKKIKTSPLPPPTRKKKNPREDKKKI